MDSKGSPEITNLQALIGLWQEEEQRLRSIISNVSTGPEVKRKVNTKLVEVLRDIEAHRDELANLEAGR